MHSLTVGSVYSVLGLRHHAEYNTGNKVNVGCGEVVEAGRSTLH